MISLSKVLENRMIYEKRLDVSDKGTNGTRINHKLITLLKDSSLVSVIGVTELMFQTQLVQSATYKGVLPLFITMMIYFILTFTLSRILLYFEGRMKHVH